MLLKNEIEVQNRFCRFHCCRAEATIFFHLAEFLEYHDKNVLGYDSKGNCKNLPGLPLVDDACQRVPKPKRLKWDLSPTCKVSVYGLGHDLGTVSCFSPRHRDCKSLVQKPRIWAVRPKRHLRFLCMYMGT